MIIKVPSDPSHSVILWFKTVKKTIMEICKWKLYSWIVLYNRRTYCVCLYIYTYIFIRKNACLIRCDNFVRKKKKHKKKTLNVFPFSVTVISVEARCHDADLKKAKEKEGKLVIILPGLFMFLLSPTINNSYLPSSLVCFSTQQYSLIS